MRIDLFRFFSSTLLGLFLLAETTSAQRVKVEVDKPDFEDLQSPELGGNTGKKKWSPKDWLEAEVKLRIEAEPAYKEEFVDNLTIRWYVAVENPSKKGSYFLMEKEVTYINVPLKEDVFASVYLSPASIMRLTGGDRAGKSAVWGIGGVVNFNGSKVVSFSSRSTKEWWNSAQLSRSDKFPLMSKSETPFKFLWWDRYLQEKERR